MPRGQKPIKPTPNVASRNTHTPHHPSGGDPTHVDPVAMPKPKDYIKEIYELTTGDDPYVHWRGSVSPTISNATLFNFDHGPRSSVPSSHTCPAHLHLPPHRRVLLSGCPSYVLLSLLPPLSSPRRLLSCASPPSPSTRSLPCIDGAGVTLAPKSLLSVFFFSPYPCAPRRSPPHARTCSPSPPRASSSPAHRLQLLLPVLSPACGAGVCHPRPKSVLSVFSFSPYPCAPQRSPLHTRTCSHTHTRSHAHSHAHSHTYLHTHTRRPGTGPPTYLTCRYAVHLTPDTSARTHTHTLHY